MTFSYFDENITTWQSLIDFCHSEGLEFCADIYSRQEMSDYINEYVAEHIDELGWMYIADALDEIQRGYYFYRHGTGLIFEYLDDYGDFDDCRSDVIYAMAGYWDDEAIDDEILLEEFDEILNDANDDKPEEPITLEDLFLESSIVCSKSDNAT